MERDADKSRKPSRSSHHSEQEKYEYGRKRPAPGEHDANDQDGAGGDHKDVPAKEKEKPTLALSGNLNKDTNTFNGVVVKYNEPAEARKPIKRWRLYCFKGDTELPFYPMHRQSAYLIGRDRLVADIPVEHPSCSKQHAVFQYRLIEYKRRDGTTGRAIKPYVIDLGSTNGSFVNNKQIEPQRYYELREKDVLKFGFSSREYVLLHEESKNNNNGEEEEHQQQEATRADDSALADKREKLEKS